MFMQCHMKKLFNFLTQQSYHAALVNVTSLANRDRNIIDYNRYSPNVWYCSAVYSFSSVL